MIYAYVANNTVTELEKRTRTGDIKLEDLYHEDLIPYFVPVPPELEEAVRPGWLYTALGGFVEPKPFEINPETGEMYLPAGIPAETFWRTISENIRLQNEVQQLTAVVDTLLIENLTEKGALLSE